VCRDSILKIVLPPTSHRSHTDPPPASSPSYPRALVPSRPHAELQLRPLLQSPWLLLTQIFESFSSALLLTTILQIFESFSSALLLTTILQIFESFSSALLLTTILQIVKSYTLCSTVYHSSPCSGHPRTPRPHTFMPSSSSALSFHLLGMSFTLMQTFKSFSFALLLTTILPTSRSPLPPFNLPGSPSHRAPAPPSPSIAMVRASLL
jgi:hypothetical protein